MDKVVQTCWDGYKWLWEELWLFTGVIETQYLSFLWRAKHAQGWDGGCVYNWSLVVLNLIGGK